MCLESSAWNSTVAYLTWRPKATKAGRSLFQLVPSMPNTDETGCGLWRTPGATDGEGGVMEMREDAAGHYKLRDQVQPMNQKFWPTASGRDYKDTPGMARTGTNPDGSERKREDQLARAVYAGMWPSPTASTGGPEPEGKTGRKLATHVVGSLNPTWVEWLMGYPLGWTDLKDSETPSCHKSRRKSCA